ncbi:hypothetical protein [Prauserella cavernicola]|uniref:hypothetical protein n=1 Tax=Prauserella cavernicola TaxID=2800127 RepID=UPI0027DE71FE|nr:hypothetical protein [Prauserella cavernicola]
MTEPAFLHDTRTFYDALAVDYAALFERELQDRPLARAMLGVFAEHVLAGGGGPVADVGCGPGVATAYCAPSASTRRASTCRPRWWRWRARSFRN